MPGAEPVPKLPSAAQKLSQLAAFSTSPQTTHPDTDTQTTCVRNAVRLGNRYQYFSLITCTDGPFSATHLFYLFNSFDYFLLMAWIYPFHHPFETSELRSGGYTCAGRHVTRQKEQIALPSCTTISLFPVATSSVHMIPMPWVIMNVDSGAFSFQQ